MNNLLLALGVFTYPTKSFDQIIKEKRPLVGISIWLFHSILYLLVWTVIIRNASSWELPTHYAFLAALIQPKVIIKIVGVFIYAYFINLIAKSFFKYQGDYAGMLLCNLIILVVGSLNLLIVLAWFYYFGPTTITNYLMLVFIPWIIFLDFIAVKRVYKATSGHGIAIVALALILNSVLLLLFRLIMMSLT